MPQPVDDLLLCGGERLGHADRELRGDGASLGEQLGVMGDELAAQLFDLARPGALLGELAGDVSNWLAAAAWVRNSCAEIGVGRQATTARGDGLTRTGWRRGRR
jgi:hypothetical protein